MTPSDFLEKLVRAEASAGVTPPSGSQEWTEYMWKHLHTVQRGAELFCNCRTHDREESPGDKKEWLWDMVWTDNRLEKQFVPVEVVIEHENAYGNLPFLDDFWKIMASAAPLRVAIGYVGRRSDVEPRLHQIHDKISNFVDAGGRFPSFSEDLVLTRACGERAWHALVRHRGENCFTPLASRSAVVANESQAGFWRVPLDGSD